MSSRFQLLFSVALFCGLPFFTAIAFDRPAAFAQDWPQWRGPGRNGVLEPPITDTSALPTLNWTQAVSGGYSGPTVVDGRIYLMDRQTKPGQIERVLCLDEKSGSPVWTHAYDAPYEGIGYTTGPRASVTVEDGRAYSIGSMGQAFCFDAATGEVLWEIDFDKKYAVSASKRMPIWGIAASPLVVDNNVIFHVGGAEKACIVAIDCQSGKETWRALQDRAQYSAPVMMDVPGGQAIVCWTGDSISALSPATGELRWRYEFKPSRMPIGIATPVIQGNKIFVTSFYDGSLMLAVNQDGSGVEKVWAAVGPNERKTKSLQSIISTPIWLGDYIYGVDSYGQLRCLDAKTGERLWENLDVVPRARWSTIHFVKNGQATDSEVWMFNERGELLVGDLSPQGFEEKWRKQIIAPTMGQLPRRNGVCWSHPAFANGNVIVRSDSEIKSWNLRRSN